MADQRIGILGSGAVGRALGSGFARHGWDVLLGTRSVQNLQRWLDETAGNVAVGSFVDAASYADVVALGTPGATTEAALELAGPDRFDDSLVLDATNPLDFTGGMPPDLLYGGTDSLGEHVQAILLDASVVKCFNTVSSEQLVDPEFETATPPMLICGDDPAAKDRTDAIVRELGWSGALDVGDIEAARYLEALVPLWARTGVALDTWLHALAVVR